MMFWEKIVLAESTSTSKVVKIGLIAFDFYVLDLKIGLPYLAQDGFARLILCQLKETTTSPQNTLLPSSGFSKKSYPALMVWLAGNDTALFAWLLYCMA